MPHACRCCSTRTGSRAQHALHRLDPSGSACLVLALSEDWVQTGCGCKVLSPTADMARRPATHMATVRHVLWRACACNVPGVRIGVQNKCTHRTGQAFGTHAACVCMPLPCGRSCCTYPCVHMPFSILPGDGRVVGCVPYVCRLVAEFSQVVHLQIAWFIIRSAARGAEGRNGVAPRVNTRGQRQAHGVC